MPRYDYQCPTCGEITEHWVRLKDLDSELFVCVPCEQYLHRLISSPNIQCDIEPYLDDAMDSEPQWVESRQHKKELLKERELVQW